jgi:hypothetical protein
MIDLLRNSPREALARFFPPAAPGESVQLPAGVKFLTALFLPPVEGQPQNGVTKVMAGAVTRLLGIHSARQTR